MAKRKPKTIAQLVEQAAVLTQKLVRMKAAMVEGSYISCVTCGVKKHWKEMQGGHYISRRYTKYKIEEENIHPQCAYCNGPLRGNYQNYTLYMIDMYGRDHVEHMLETKGETKKYARADIIEIVEELKSQVKEMESKL